MKKLFWVAIAAASLFGPPAFAAPVFDWSGWYAGASAGYGFGSNQITNEPNSPGAVIRAGFVSPELGTDPKGFVGGLQLGFNQRAGNIVYGWEADFSHAGIRDQTIGPFLIVPFNFQTTGSERLDWFGTFRARAGVAAGERSLVFITGGLAYGRAALSTFAIDTSANLCGGVIKFCATGSAEKWMIGWTVGAGWEYAFAGSWSAKLEYLRYDLGKITNSMTDILAPPDNFRGSTDIKGNIVRLGFNYKFGR